MLDILKFVGCGYEHSGTTLLSTILRQHPRLDSGFEGGFLFGQSPRDFPSIQPYYRYFKECWEVSEEQAQFICDTDQWAECYRRARDVSPIITDKSVLLYDKTPGYMRVLSSVLEKAPQIPCVVMVRDPRSLMVSWAKRTGFETLPKRWVERQLPQLCGRYMEYAEGYNQAIDRFAQRIMLIQFERLCLEPEAVLTRLFAFLGLDFDPRYLSFSDAFGVHGNNISGEYLAPHREYFPAAICKEILQRTARQSQWHFDGQEPMRRAG